MMEAHRAEGNMLVLVITKLLLDRDTFETGEMAARVRSQGWAMRAGVGVGAGMCAGCQRSLMPLKQLGIGDGGACAIAIAGVRL